MPRLELNLMGVPEIRLDGKLVNLSRRASIGLLAYLVLTRRAHARETLATLMAGDTSDGQARKHLSNVLGDLRQQLGDYVVATRQTVSFDHDLTHAIDVDQFHASLAAAGDGESPGDLARGIDLYRDEFLAGVVLDGAPDFDTWLAAEREELRQQYISALRTRVESSMRRGDWASGIESARKLIATEPWLEEGHRQLMQMLASAGDRLAAISQYNICQRVLREELDIAPQPQTTALYERLRAADVPAPNNLAAPSGRLVGRVEELRLLTALLADPDCRMSTIVGLGGSGKTRLALEVARAYANPNGAVPQQPFPDGVYFVALDSVAAGEPPLAATSLLAAVEATLGLSLARIGARRMLLVLDNIEHLYAGAGALTELLAKAPHVKLLVTSRVPLHLAGERVLRLDGLRLPRSGEELEDAEASALFLDEARRTQVGFELADADRSQLVRLCGLLGGVPLALLLAARWTSVLACSAIVEQLGPGLDVLSASDADLPLRHRSLSGIVEGTLAGLPAEERALAQALVLASSDGEGAPQSTSRPMTADLLNHLRLLNERSLVFVDTTRGTFRLHPLLVRYVRGASVLQAAA